MVRRMIKSMEIVKLFNRFDYNIELKSDGVTIITGPNGFGKSTILKIIDAVSRKDISFFLRLDFDSIRINFSNNRKVSIEKTKDNTLIFDGNKIELSLGQLGHRHVPWIQQISPNTWIDVRTNMRISNDELPFYNFLSNNIEYDISDIHYFNKKYTEGDIKKLKQKLENMSKWSGSVRLISEQRLIKKELGRMDEDQIIDVITELPQKLKREISQVSEEYSRVANQLDGSYPSRLFNTKDGLKDSIEYNEKLEEANKKFEKLNKYKLVDMQLIDELNYDEKHSTALKIYFDDFSKKYTVFEDLIVKMDLFTKIINDRLAFKKIVISQQNGFEVVDTDFSDKNLKLNQLSSGEKQEIVLFYELIFDTKSDLLLLIDEPEISLHITWQQKFLDDLLKVVEKTKNLQVIVSTHSPQIIGDHWDIQIDLGELYGK